MKVRDVMNKQFITANENTSLPEVAKILIENKISGVPVINDNSSLTGFISERDIIAATVDGKDISRKVTKTIMSSKVTSVAEDTPLSQVYKIFSEQLFRYLPVIDENQKIIGIVARDKVLEHLKECYY